MTENICTLKLRGSSEPQTVYLGIDTDPDTSKVRQRVASYVHSCGERHLIANRGTKTLPPPLVMVLVYHAGPNLPDTVRQTVQIGNRKLTVVAKVVSVDSIPLEDMLGSGPMRIMLPSYGFRFSEEFGEIDADPERRRAFLRDMRIVAQAIADPAARRESTDLEDWERDKEHMAATALGVLEEALEPYPVLWAELRDIFADLITEEAYREHMRRANENADK